MSADDHESYTPEKPEPIRVYIPTRLLLVPGAAVVVGLTIGFVRGSRSASLRFLAENVHRPPTTVQGWYFYNKTKNYRVFLGGLKGGGKNAAGLGAAALGWVGIEEALKLAGAPWEEFSEVGAGLGTAAVFAAACKCRHCHSVLPERMPKLTSVTCQQTAYRGERRDGYYRWG